MALFSLQNLHVAVGDTPLVKGVSFEIGAGEVHILMGPNGSGKTTLAHALMGNPMYKITAGNIFFDDEDVTSLSPDARAKKGLFLGFQYPAEVTGVQMDSFIKNVWAARGMERTADSEVVATLASVRMPGSFLQREVNVGFSGGEKKRSELLQMQLFKPRVAILDEFDSGLDVDGIRAACAVLKEYITRDRGLLLITHYGEIAKYIAPTKVHIMKEGRIVATGGEELIALVASSGFDSIF